MRTASEWRTPCEILRMINDLCQGTDDKDIKIRLLTAEGEKLTKMLAKEVSRSNPPFLKKRGLWKPNIGWRSLLKRRLESNYLQEGSRGNIGKL